MQRLIVTRTTTILVGGKPVVVPVHSYLIGPGKRSVLTLQRRRNDRIKNATVNNTRADFPTNLAITTGFGYRQQLRAFARSRAKEAYRLG